MRLAEARLAIKLMRLRSEKGKGFELVCELEIGFGVPRDIRERVLNHGGKRTGGITEAVYSWYDYAAEKRAALELWADALMCLVERRTEVVLVDEPAVADHERGVEIRT